MFRSFKDGIKTTFVEELSNRLTYGQILKQSNTFILQYGVFKVLTMVML